MQQVIVRISGTTPLLMHNRRLSDPLDPFVIEIRKLTSKGAKKTEEDHLQIRKLEFLAGLYYDKKSGVYIPAENIDAAIREGATQVRKGATVERGISTQELKVPLTYEGPRDPEQMYAAGLYDYRRVGVNRGSSTMRCRPIFQEWGCEFTLSVNPTIISLDDLRHCLDLAGQRTGLGDYRPRYGKFQVDEWITG